MNSIVINEQTWNLGEQIGQGGFSSVYVATCEEVPGKFVAKIVKDENSSREAAIAEKLIGIEGVIIHRSPGEPGLPPVANVAPTSLRFQSIGAPANQGSSPNEGLRKTLRSFNP
jgi:hypothetical protein